MESLVPDVAVVGRLLGGEGHRKPSGKGKWGPCV